jgi:hypothetical protein
MTTKLLIQCTGKMDTYDIGEKGIALEKCIHWWPVTRSEEPQRVDMLKVYCAAFILLAAVIIF